MITHTEHFETKMSKDTEQCTDITGIYINVDCFKSSGLSILLKCLIILHLKNCKIILIYIKNCLTYINYNTKLHF